MKHEYSTMKQIGGIYGITSHKVGRKLKELGYRTEKGSPSKMAFDDGLVKQRWAQDSFVYQWVWHTEKVADVLDEAGLERIKDDEES